MRKKGMILAAGAAAGLLLAAAAVWWLTRADVSSLGMRNPASTALMEQRRHEAARAGKALTISQSWVPLEAIPLTLRRAVLISEDASFYQHSGVDFFELKESLKRDWREKSLARGGSTITQQLAKNLYLSTAKSPLRKLREYVITRKLERHLTKDRILYLYLNVIELGPGVFGVDAAARYWFGKPSASLTLGEMVRLTAIIPRPLRGSPRDNSAWIRWRAKWILSLLKNYGYITPDTYREAAREFVPPQ